MDKKGIKISRPVTMLNKYWVVKLRWKYMKTPRQWINTWLKEELMEIDSVDCFMACYTEVLFKVISYNIRVKLKEAKRAKKPS